MDDVTLLIRNQGVNLHRIAVRVAFPGLFRLAAFVVAGENAMMGRAIREHLEGLYDGELKLTDDQIGDKAMKVQRYSQEDDKEDVVQDLMRYLHESKWKSAHAQTIDQAFAQLLSNLRVRSQSQGMSDLKKRKKVVPLEDLWDEEQVKALKTDPESSLGKPADERVDILNFIENLDAELPLLMEQLTPDEKALFDVIYNDDTGTFTPDIKQNMNQSASLKEKYPDIYKKNAKRWSGFVGDLRKKLLKKIYEFTEKDISEGSWDTMAEMA